MKTIELSINGKARRISVAGDTPLLWVLRDELKLTGTKFSCGIGACGACTVHIDGKAVQSCQAKIEDIANSHVVTIEHISKDKIHKIQQAWINAEVSQCGYCQPGHIMKAIALFSNKPSLSRDEFISAMSSNLCRCGTYNRMINAMFDAAPTVE